MLRHRCAFDLDPAAAAATATKQQLVKQRVSAAALCEGLSTVAGHAGSSTARIRTVEERVARSFASQADEFKATALQVGGFELRERHSCELGKRA